MKKLMAAAIVITFAGVSATWALVGLEDVSYDGSLEVTGISANNETDYSASNDHRGGVNTRVRVGINTTITEGVSGRLEFTRRGSQYGRDFSGNTGANATNNINEEEANINIQNAYIDLGEHFFLKNIRLGRQYVGEPGDLVWNISSTDNDILSINAIDGILLEGLYLDEMLAVSVFTGKYVEDDGVAGTDSGDVTGDVNLSNIEANIKEVLPNGRIRLAFLSGKDANAAARSDDNKLRTYRVGVDGGLMESMITYRAQFLQNAGEFNSAGLDGAGNPADLDYKGNAFDVGVGLNLKETGAGSFSFVANFVAASGDDNVIDDEDESFHDFSAVGAATSDAIYGEIGGKSPLALGAIGINTADATGSAPSALTQGQGLEILHLGVKYVPNFIEKVWGKLDFYTFARAEGSVKTGAATTQNVRDDLGDEIDLTLGYDPSDNVGIETGYAFFSPGDALTGGGSNPDEDITKLFARIKVMWGGEGE